MKKPLVFISHITQEAEMATEVKTLIEQNFVGMIEVLVSSDCNIIKMGQKWLDSISEALGHCAIEIVICIPLSVQRPWINFEAGAGWVRGIPVIPLCHSGMEPSKLPVPLNLLQAAKLTDLNALKLVFPVFANALGASSPKIDFTDFIKKINDFEERYTFWTKCNEAFAELEKIQPEITIDLKKNTRVGMGLTETEINCLKPHIKFLSVNMIIQAESYGETQLTNTGLYYTWVLTPLSKFSDTVNHAKFNINH